MNTNNIQLTQILGTDSLSSSRILINDNFKILANALNNYQNYFDENGVYSSVIISNNETGTIEFKTDENHEIMTLSSDGIEINGSLVVHGNGNDPTILEEIKTNKITKLSEEEDSVITINGSVHIEGDLTVNGDTPGGGDSGSTISKISLEDFNRKGQDIGYIETYNLGCYVEASSRADILYKVIDKFLAGNPTKLLQYINKPFTVIGKGCRVNMQNLTLSEKVLTNGVFSQDRNYIICPGFNREEDAGRAITEVKIYPLIVANAVCVKIEFSSVMRQN